MEGVLEKGFDVAQGSGCGTGAGAAGSLVMDLNYIPFNPQYIESAAIISQSRTNSLVKHGFNDEGFFFFVAIRKSSLWNLSRIDSGSSWGA